MGNLKETTKKYSYNDVAIQPAIISEIEHRMECNPFDENGKLPLFTAPMDTVVNKNNFALFEKEGINPILPRTETIHDRLFYACNSKWAAFSLQEFEQYFIDGNIDEYYHEDKKKKVLIDIANGHVAILYTLVKKAKRKYGSNIDIMVGNIANPETYRMCVAAKCYGVRVGIGGGCGCLSSSNLGVHYPIASLISEINEIKKEFISQGADANDLPKIIADGGVRNYSDIIKAIALGADYVMCGSIFAKMLESAAKKSHQLDCYEKIYKLDDGWYGDYTDNFFEELKSNCTEKCTKNKHFIGEINAEFYGMASRQGQIAMKGKKTHTSEGVLKILPVEYTMPTWVENFIDYIRSAMSYTNARELSSLKNANVVIISDNTYNSINK